MDTQFPNGLSDAAEDSFEFETGFPMLVMDRLNGMADDFQGFDGQNGDRWEVDTTNAGTASIVTNAKFGVVSIDSAGVGANDITQIVNGGEESPGAFSWVGTKEWWFKARFEVFLPGNAVAVAGVATAGDTNVPAGTTDGAFFRVTNNVLEFVLVNNGSEEVTSFGAAPTGQFEMAFHFNPLDQIFDVWVEGLPVAKVSAIDNMREDQLLSLVAGIADQANTGAKQLLVDYIAFYERLVR